MNNLFLKFLNKLLCSQSAEALFWLTECTITKKWVTSGLLKPVTFIWSTLYLCSWPVWTGETSIGSAEWVGTACHWIKAVAVAFRRYDIQLFKVTVSRIWISSPLFRLLHNYYQQCAQHYQVLSSTAFVVHLSTVKIYKWKKTSFNSSLIFNYERSRLMTIY